jgi:hypothetical protein
MSDTPLDELIATQTMTPKPKRVVPLADAPEVKCPYCRSWIPFNAPERCQHCGAAQ